MYKYYLIFLLLFSSCVNSKTLSSPEVKVQIRNDILADIIAGGGALIVTGGNVPAAVIAITAQELKNIPKLNILINKSTSGK